MRSPIIEPIEHFQHRFYLHRHFAEDPFPLNGSDWARLVNERLERERHPCLCHHCFNFLTHLHSKESPLGRERRGIQKAMHHWFLQGQPTYRHDFLRERAEKAASEFVSELSESETKLEEIGLGKSLKEAERQWLKENVHVTRVELVEGIKSTQAVASAEEIDNPVISKHKPAEKKHKLEDKYWEADSSDFFESRPTDLRHTFPAEQRAKHEKE